MNVSQEATKDLCVQVIEVLCLHRVSEYLQYDHVLLANFRSSEGIGFRDASYNFARPCLYKVEVWEHIGGYI